MSTAQEQIEEIQRQIVNLRHQAVLELKVKLADARATVAALERELAQATGSTAPEQASKSRKARVSITMEQIVEALKAGAYNYRTVSTKLGCSTATVTSKIKAEGKNAGITSTGEKASFRLSVR